MALIHNILLRGLNSIYNQALNISFSEDVTDFMIFCDAWSCTMHSHHKTEEEVYFPMLEEQCTKKGVASRNHDEHETFLRGFGVFDEFVRGVREGEREYGGLDLVRLRYRGAHKSNLNVLRYSRNISFHLPKNPY